MKRLPDAATAHPANVSLTTVQLVSPLSRTPLHFPPGHCFHTYRSSSTSELHRDVSSLPLIPLQAAPGFKGRLRDVWSP